MDKLTVDHEDRDYVPRSLCEDIGRGLLGRVASQQGFVGTIRGLIGSVARELSVTGPGRQAGRAPNTATPRPTFFNFC